jgi:hypothetical protein
MSERRVQQAGNLTKNCCSSVRCGAFVRLFKSGQAGADAAGYSSAMSIVRDDCGECQVRVDRMIDEFREAQSRRRARATE